MLRIFVLCIAGLLGFNPTWGQKMLNIEKGWKIPVYDYSGLDPILHIENDTTYVVNFWATWCVPCVKELPYFEDLQKERGDKKLQVVLVSLDFPRHFDSKLIPFLKKHQLKSRVVVLDDPDANSWIDKISLQWSGAIPATLVFNGNKRNFHEKTFHTFDELNAILKPFINL